MRTLIVAFALVVGMLAGMAGTAMADQPPGQLGYEGQPGNQGAHQNVRAVVLARRWPTCCASFA